MPSGRISVQVMLQEQVTCIDGHSRVDCRWLPALCSMQVWKQQLQLQLLCLPCLPVSLMHSRSRILAIRNRWVANMSSMQTFEASDRDQLRKYTLCFDHLLASNEFDACVLSLIALLPSIMLKCQGHNNSKSSILGHGSYGRTGVK